MSKLTIKGRDLLGAKKFKLIRIRRAFTLTLANKLTERLEKWGDKYGDIGEKRIQISTKERDQIRRLQVQHASDNTHPTSSGRRQHFA